MIERSHVVKATAKTAYTSSAKKIDQGTTTIERNRELAKYLVTHPDGTITVRQYRCSARNAAHTWLKQDFARRRHADPTLEIGLSSIRWI